MRTPAATPLGGHPTCPSTFVAFDLAPPGWRRPHRLALLDDLHMVGPAWATNGWYCDGEGLFGVRRASSRGRRRRAARLALPGRPADLDVA